MRFVRSVARTLLGWSLLFSMHLLARDYHFDGSMSEAVLRSYLSQSMTTMNVGCYDCHSRSLVFIRGSPFLAAGWSGSKATGQPQRLLKCSPTMSTVSARSIQSKNARSDKRCDKGCRQSFQLR